MSEDHGVQQTKEQLVPHAAAAYGGQMACCYMAWLSGQLNFAEDMKAVCKGQEMRRGTPAHLEDLRPPRTSEFFSQYPVLAAAARSVQKLLQTRNISVKYRHPMLSHVGMHTPSIHLLII